MDAQGDPWPSDSHELIMLPLVGQCWYQHDPETTKVKLGQVLNDYNSDSSKAYVQHQNIRLQRNALDFGRCTCIKKRLRLLFPKKIATLSVGFYGLRKTETLAERSRSKDYLKMPYIFLEHGGPKMTYFRKPWGALKTIGKYIFIAQKCFLLSYHSVNWVCGLPSWPNNFHVILKLARIWSLAKH